MSDDIQEILDEAKLVYMQDTKPGITRQKAGKKFSFYDVRGNKIIDEKQLKRLNGLVLPPAWTDVWIAPKANAHLQATGIDTAGRKQYRYHEEWSKHRNETKYFRLLEFGSKLPEFRKNILKDLKRRKLDERKVLAIAVNMLEKTLIRIGNESYKVLYGSYGLTTLRDKHVKFQNGKTLLAFVGKKGVSHQIELTDKSLARMVKKCRDIPGQELFQYYDDNGKRCSIDSGQINRYIKEVTCCDFTAKDFRTWAGTLEMLKLLATYEAPLNETIKKKTIVACLDDVALKLGNTRAVCKKSYVFPALIEAYENGTLMPYLKKVSQQTAGVTTKKLNADEKVLLKFLKDQKNKKKQAA